MATNAAFLTALQGLTITGVNRHLNTPPESVNTASLPLAFPNTLNGQMPLPVLGCYATNKIRTGQFVVVVSPTGQDTIAQIYGQLPALMDNLETALDALAKNQGGTLANVIEYTIDYTSDFVISGVAYWAIVADINARDVP